MKEGTDDRGMLRVKAKGGFSRRPLRELQTEATLLPESQQSISITSIGRHSTGAEDGGRRAFSETVKGVKSTLSALLKRWRGSVMLDQTC